MSETCFGNKYDRTSIECIECKVRWSCVKRFAKKIRGEEDS